jgi:hypothetical protein
MPNIKPRLNRIEVFHMPGERHLRALLSAMRPHLCGGEFVFCTVPPETLGRLRVSPVGWFREREGVSLIVPKDDADKEGLPYDFVARMITLDVESSLDAVGFLAAVTGRLAEAGIAVNPVSAYFHDHLFVPSDRADEAMRVLGELMRESAAS